MNFIRNKDKISVSLSARDLTEGREGLDRLLADVPLSDPPGQLIISSRGSDDCGWTELRAILSLMERARSGGFAVELRLPPGISGPLALLGVDAHPLS